MLVRRSDQTIFCSGILPLSGLIWWFGFDWFLTLPPPLQSCNLDKMTGCVSTIPRRNPWIIFVKVVCKKLVHCRALHMIVVGGTNNQMFASPPISKICSTHICRNNSKQGNKLPREQHLHICINSFYSVQRICKKKRDPEQQIFNDVNL